MTIAKLLLGIIASQALFIITKLIFITILDIDSAIFQYILFLAIAVIAVSVVRRMGTINYIESFFLVIVWLVISLVLDLAITTQITGRDVYKTFYFWVCYIIMILAMIMFHKKSHVEVRKLQAEQNKQ